LPTQAAHSRTCLADAQDIPQGGDLISLTGSVAATRGRQVWDVIFRHIGASDVEGHLDLNGRWRAEVGDLLKSPTDAATSRRRIEMFQYRIALAQMRRGASEREIARSHCMGRHKLADLRVLAEQHGWLDKQTPLPEDAEIAAALGAPRLPASTVSTLEP